MRLIRSRVYRTLALEWDSDRPRIILGLTGMDRPSIQWHAVLWWRKLKNGRSDGSRTNDSRQQ